MLSVIIWLFSWAYLIRKKAKVGYADIMLLGISCLYGALTPVQIGAEALRAMHIKDKFSVAYSDSLAASMIAKGTKFLLIAAIAAIVFISVYFSIHLEGIFLFSFLSGFAVIIIAVFFFLAPLNPFLAKKISDFFAVLGKRIKFFSRVSGFFTNYSQYLKFAGIGAFVFVFFLNIISWLFEFLAFYFSFWSVGVTISLLPAAFLMVLISVFERTPFLPRGIGIVELISYNFLAMPALAGEVLSAGQIGAVIVTYGIIRLIIPTVISIAVNFYFFKIRK
jgi:uncharacterized protein (TIRG00374 family)